MRRRRSGCAAPLLFAWGAFGACYATAPRAFAVQTLNVDLSKPIGPAKHLANGSLYGVIETKPADVQTLIAPLHPNMFTNPAASGPGLQQPVGDAIVVAGRVAPVGATVTIRLADWFPGWYSFTTMTDWLSKVDQTIARKQAANLTNVYGYELWNEPNGTWHSTTLTFDDFWKQTYDHVRAAEPTVKIIGPSVAGYNASYLNDFLTYCKTNDCLPDIVSWHDGAGIESNVQNYRAMEKQLGIGPLPISINEISYTADVTHEGEPGASAKLIAGMERQRVDSACITFWDVAHPGRLGSLLATDTQPNGGWYFYEWYGEMAGRMLTTTASASTGSGYFDGFASLDTSQGVASILLGGGSDGSVQIVVKGFAAAGVPSKVHAVVEHTPWAGNPPRSTVVMGTDTLSTADLTTTGDSVTVSIPNTSVTDGYRLLLSWTAQGGSPGDAAVGMVTDAGASLDATITGRDGSIGPRADAAVPPATSASEDAEPGMAATEGGSRSGSSGSPGNSGSPGPSDAAVPLGTDDDAGSSIGGAVDQQGCNCATTAQRGEPSAFFVLIAVALGIGAGRRRARRGARGAE